MMVQVEKMSQSLFSSIRSIIDLFTREEISLEKRWSETLKHNDLLIWRMKAVRKLNTANQYVVCLGDW